MSVRANTTGAAVGAGAAGLNTLANGAKSPVYKVTESGMQRVINHLGKLDGGLSDPGNQGMLNRLNAGQRTSQDMNFYLHELKESAVFSRNGGNYNSAQLETLQWQGISDKAVGTAQLYHPEVILKNAGWFNPGAIDEAKWLMGK